MSRNFDALQRAEPAGAKGVLQRIAEERVLQAQWVPAMTAEAVMESPQTDEPVPPASFRVVPLRLTPGPAMPFDGSHPDAAEQYRSIRTKVTQHVSQPRTILVSSSGPGEGKTTTAANLAGAIALNDDTSVVLVDADFRRSSVSDLLGIPQGPGLRELLSGACKIEDAILQIEQFPNLHVLPNGVAHPSPSELLASSHWPALVGELRRRFQFVVMDAPPMAAVTDVDLIRAVCDGVILVICADRSETKVLHAAMEAIPDGKLIGVVLNQVQNWFLWKNPHAYTYYYSAKERL